jgi:hypothetical protein
LKVVRERGGNGTLRGLAARLRHRAERLRDIGAQHHSDRTIQAATS